MTKSHTIGRFVFTVDFERLDISPSSPFQAPGISVPVDALTAFVLNVLAPGASDAAPETRGIRRILFGAQDVCDAVLAPSKEALAHFHLPPGGEGAIPDEVVVRGTRTDEGYPRDGSESPFGDIAVPFSTLRTFVFDRLRDEVAENLEDTPAKDFETLALFIVAGLRRTPIPSHDG